MNTAGVILAGGRATRMGGRDKGLIPFAGQPLIAHVLARLTPQVDQVVISANRNQEAYAGFSVPVLVDTISGFVGPLAGLLAALEQTHASCVVMVPCDSPFLPPDLIVRLEGARSAMHAEIAVAHDGERRQPAFLLVQRQLAGDLRAWLEQGGRKIDAWFARHVVADANLADCPDAFFNINSPQDLLAAEQRGSVNE